MSIGDFDRWLLRDLWSEGQLVYLCCGIMPGTSVESNDEINEARDFVSMALHSKVLPCTCPQDVNAADKLHGYARFIKPADAIRWASSKFQKFPIKTLPPGASDFDKNDATYPPELDIAMQAHRAVSTTDGKGKPKARIKAWLDANTELSNDAKDRIATVANWDKAGGATRSE